MKNYRYDGDVSLGCAITRTSGSEAGGGQRLSRLQVSLRGGLLAFLPSFHTATRTPPGDTAHRKRLPSIHTPAHTPPGLPARRTAACVPSTHASSHGTRVVWRHIYCFYIWMINAAALLLNRSMARIHCWSNAHGSDK